MDFERRKAQSLAAMSSPAPDKSPKGGIDAPIVPLLAVINRHPSYFTTSSCSGRISILSHAAKNTSDINNKKEKKKAGGGRWIYVSHDPADPAAVVDLLFGDSCPSPPGAAIGGELVFRFEPLIIAVECRDAAAAQALVSAAISSGFRESGITSIHKRVMVAIRCSIRLEVPLGQIGSILVSPQYVRYLVMIANEKMETNRRRMDGFLEVLQEKGLPGLDGKIDSTKKHKYWFAAEKLLDDREARQTAPLPNDSDSSKLRNEDHLLGLVKNSHDSEPAECSEEEKVIANCSEGLLAPSDNSHMLDFQYCSKQTTGKDHNLELSGSTKCTLSAAEMMITGEPSEKLFLWGQSACILSIQKQEQIFIFGGFGGLGRHARRNYFLMLDPSSGLLKEVNNIGPPSPRLGHTSSVVGDRHFIIGGRGGPAEILNDIWVICYPENKWMLLECHGSVFHPRHRHAAAAVGLNIYAFGGLNDEVIYSSMHVLNTESFHWTEVTIQGEWPCPRHSHSMVANGSQLYMFGGFDGEKALGDLYSFDVRTLLWKKERTTGRPPYPRFSHSMFIHNNHIGIIGGCPVMQQCQQLSLFNLFHSVWVHVEINSIGRCLWVRCSTCVVGDDLVIVGGGASCYAFGAMFNQPMKINLKSLDSIFRIASGNENKPVKPNEASGKGSLQCNKLLEVPLSNLNENDRISIFSNGDEHCIDRRSLVLQLEKKYAKHAKDTLKRFGWLDVTRKVHRNEDNCHIRLPVTRNFYTFFQKEHHPSDHSFDESDFSHQLETSESRGLSENDASIAAALDCLFSCKGSLLAGDVACNRKTARAPQKIMREHVSNLLERKGIQQQPQLLEQLPTRWERLGDIIVLPVTSFKDPVWDSIGQELCLTVATLLGTKRLARQGRILPNGTRDSTLEILVGDNGWVTRQENGIVYSFDATKCMFSSGNLSEKLRMAQLDCRNEVIVDLFAGIGYFVLPFLVKAKAEQVYACEWNPHALTALKHNVHANSVAERCVIVAGDNRVTAPKGVADRVCLGLLPSSECSWSTAVQTLRVYGGILHVHGNVKDTEEHVWLEYLVKSIRSISESEGLSWDVSIEHVERVKWYGPHIRHLVADVSCRKL